MAITTQERELINVDELAIRLRCHRKTVLRAIKRGTLRPAVRTSRKLILFDPENLTGAGQVTQTSSGITDAEKKKIGERHHVTASELSLLLGIHKQTIYSLAWRNEIPSIKVGHARRFDVDAVKESLKIITLSNAQSSNLP